MPEKAGMTYEVLKYPAAILSVVVALWVAKWLIGFDISNVSELTMAGVKFRDVQEATDGAVTSLDQRLREATERIEALEQQLADARAAGNGGGQPGHTTNGGGPPSATANGGSDGDRAEFATERVMQVSDPVAQIARIGQADKGSLLKGKQGYIFLGNYERDSRELKRSVLIGGSPSSPTPTSLDAFLPGKEFKLRSNTRLLDRLPPNNERYYRASKALGTLTRGTIVTVVEDPKPIKREKAVECWVKVEVTN